jgi:hypothetical protein
MQNLILNNKSVKLHKSLITPQFNTRNVLTNSIWEFVTLWLKRNGKKKALFYWNQAKEFADASSSLPIESAPLLHYYSFMNAVKSLLESKGITYDEMHGIKAHNIRGNSSKITLSNEGVKILNKGILPAFSTYLRDQDLNCIHSLEDLLYNIPCIHRSFCLTYKSHSDLFIPLKDCIYLFDENTRKVNFSAKIGSDFVNINLSKRVPNIFNYNQNESKITSKDSFLISDNGKLSQPELFLLCALNNKIRNHICYINGSTTLWYLKLSIGGQKNINRSPMTLMMAAMHRLSEICRYKPIELSAFLDGQKNWLLNEFINMSPSQFYDEIASEITGHQFYLPNVRGTT